MTHPGRSFIASSGVSVTQVSTMPPPYQDILDRVLIDADRIQARTVELGRQISTDYHDKHPFTLVGILNWSMLFMTDLMRHIEAPHAIDFMDVSSYGAGARASNGAVRILMDLHISIEGRHVLIVEDIVDSGHTLDHVLRLLSARSPASLKVCALLDKRERREVDVPLAYIGFEIPNV